MFIPEENPGTGSAKPGIGRQILRAAVGPLALIALLIFVGLFSGSSDLTGVIAIWGLFFLVLILVLVRRANKKRQG